MPFAPDRLRSLRKSRSLTQLELSRRAGITCAAVEGYEQGRRTPSAARVELLANALDVDPAELLELQAAS